MPKVLRWLSFGLALLACCCLGAVVRTSWDVGESLGDAALAEEHSAGKAVLGAITAGGERLDAVAPVLGDIAVAVADQESGGAFEKLHQEPLPHPPQRRPPGPPALPAPAPAPLPLPPPPAPPPKDWNEACAAQTGSDRKAGDLTGYAMPAAHPEQCCDTCTITPGCVAWVWQHENMDCSFASGCAGCWLKSDAGKSMPNECCVTGLRKPA